jgi:hypothetical protein
MTPTSDAAMLLFLRTPLRITVKICTFEKIREPTAAEIKILEQLSIYERKELV